MEQLDADKLELMQQLATANAKIEVQEANNSSKRAWNALYDSFDVVCDYARDAKRRCFNLF